MATLLSAFVPDVRVEIPEIAPFVAEREILRACRELCEQARAWRTNITISTVADTGTVDISASLPTNTELVDVITMKAEDGRQPVTPTTWAHLDNNEQDWRVETNDVAAHYLLEDNNVLRFVPIPSSTVTDAYDARVAIKPTLNAGSVGDVLANKYDELLVHGALGRLFRMPRKPWTDFNLAAYYAGMFEEGIRDARSEAADEFQTGVPRKVRYGGL